MKSKNPDRKSEFGLNRGATYYSCRDFVDYDYEADLDPAAREWLAAFTAEYYQNTFNKQSDLHNTPESRRECYRSYNTRYRDMWNQRYRLPVHFGGDDEQPK